MKKYTLTLLSIIILASSYAQKDNDSTPIRRDTVKIGGLVIITKKDRKNEPKEVIFSTDSTYKKGNGSKSYSFNRKKKKSNITTDWFAIDLGFNNYKDETAYGTAPVNAILRSTSSTAAPNQSDLKLSSGKSINFNLWIVRQRVNLIKHVLGLKYGLGIEVFNYRYRTPLSFKDASPSFIINDSIQFSKNKLTVNYLSVPLMLTINPTGTNGFSLSAGLQLGYNYKTKTKQKSNDRGKQKETGDFGITPFRTALAADIGYKSMRLYGTYSLNKLHDNALNFTPYTIGLRLSKW